MSDLTTGPAANKAAVREFFELLTSGEFDQARAMADPTGRWTVPRRQKDNSIPEHIGFISRENMVFVVGQLTAEDDRVSAIVSGTMNRPDGAQYGKTYHFLIRFNGGKLADVCMYDDGGLAERVAAEVTP